MSLAPGHVPPGGHILEQDFQRAVFRAINAPGRSSRIWRQNCGEVQTRDRSGKQTGQFRAGAPTGAADLSGIAGPSGVRRELEIKVDAPHTPEQVAFGEMITKLGGIYLVLRYDRSLSLADNVTAAVARVDAAVAARIS